MMALAMMAGVASCSKDEDNGNNGGDATVYVENMGEGLYQPKLHVSAFQSNGVDVNTFSWDGNLLTKVTSNGSDIALEYTPEGMLKSGSFQGSTYHYSYNGNQLVAARLTSGMGLMTHIDVTHGNGHITELSYDSVSTLYLIQLATPYINFGIKESAKYSLGDATITETFAWSGDNVSKHVMNGSITIGVAPSELNSVISIGSLIHSYLEANYPEIANNQMLSGLIDQLIESIASDTREMPVDVQIVVEDTYSYDSQRNYLQYFWPMGIQVTNLSANNPINIEQKVNLNATAHYSLPSSLSALSFLLGSSTLDIPFNKEISATTESYTYEYNSYNFPIKVTSTNHDEIIIKYN